MVVQGDPRVEVESQRLARARRALGGDDIEWLWVKDHADHDGNERADALANLGCASVSTSS